MDQSLRPAAFTSLARRRTWTSAPSAVCIFGSRQWDCSGILMGLLWDLMGYNGIIVGLNGITLLKDVFIWNITMLS